MDNTQKDVSQETEEKVIISLLSGGTYDTQEDMPFLQFFFHFILISLILNIEITPKT